MTAAVEEADELAIVELSDSALDEIALDDDTGADELAEDWLDESDELDADEASDELRELDAEEDSEEMTLEDAADDVEADVAKVDEILELEETAPSHLPKP